MKSIKNPRNCAIASQISKSVTESVICRCIVALVIRMSQFYWLYHFGISIERNVQKRSKIDGSYTIMFSIQCFAFHFNWSLRFVFFFFFSLILFASLLKFEYNCDLCVASLFIISSFFLFVQFVPSFEMQTVCVCPCAHLKVEKNEWMKYFIETPLSSANGKQK